MQESRVIREAERVVARGSGDDAASLLIGIEQSQGIARAALFETAGALQVFEFAIDLQARGLRQRDGKRARRLDDMPRNPCAAASMSWNVIAMPDSILPVKPECQTGSSFLLLILLLLLLLLLRIRGAESIRSNIRTRAPTI